MAERNAMSVLETYAGADGRTLQFTAKDSAGTVINLTNYTVTITAKLGDTTKIDDQTCTVTTAASGLFEYTPLAAEIDEAGDYLGQVKLVNGSSQVDYLEPFTLKVNPTVED